MFQFSRVVFLFGLILTSAAAASQAATDPPDISSPRQASQPSVKSPTYPSNSWNYEFAAPPATDTDLVYRVDRATGEVSACGFSAKGPTVGSTVCLPAGEGAGPQPPGDYGLIRSNLAEAKGLFRVNRRTGEVSVCYVLNERVVCTAPAR